METFKKNYTRIVILISLFFLSAKNLFAQISPSSPNELPNPLGSTTDLIEFINLLITNVVLPIGSVIVVFFVIFAGFLFVTAGGNEDKLKTAKTTILWTIIGAAILLGSLAISTAIKNTIESIRGDIAIHQTIDSNA